MKQVTIVVPDCKVNLNSIAGAYEILSRADGFWQKMGKQSRLQIQIAGFVTESKVEDSYFSIHPRDLSKIKRTDFVIIPSIFEDYQVAVKKNKILIDWLSRQYKVELRSPVCAPVHFCWPLPGCSKERHVPHTGTPLKNSGTCIPL